MFLIVTERKKSHNKLRYFLINEKYFPHIEHYTDVRGDVSIMSKAIYYLFEINPAINANFNRDEKNDTITDNLLNKLSPFGGWSILLSIPYTLHSLLLHSI